MGKNILGFVLLISILAVSLMAFIEEMREDYEVFVLVRSVKFHNSKIPVWEYIGWNEDEKIIEEEAKRLQPWCAYGEYKVIPIMYSVLPYQTINFEKKTEKEYWRRIELIEKKKAPLSYI